MCVKYLVNQCARRKLTFFIQSWWKLDNNIRLLACSKDDIALKCTWLSYQQAIFRFMWVYWNCSMFGHWLVAPDCFVSPLTKLLLFWDFRRRFVQQNLLCDRRSYSVIWIYMIKQWKPDVRRDFFIIIRAWQYGQSTVLTYK